MDLNTNYQRQSHLVLHTEQALMSSSSADAGISASFKRSTRLFITRRAWFIVGAKVLTTWENSTDYWQSGGVCEETLFAPFRQGKLETVSVKDGLGATYEVFRDGGAAKIHVEGRRGGGLISVARQQLWKVSGHSWPAFSMDLETVGKDVCLYIRLMAQS